MTSVVLPNGLWNQRQLARLVDRLSAPLHLELLINLGEVSLGGVRRDRQLPGDFLGRLARSEELEDFAFTRREAQRADGGVVALECRRRRCAASGQTMPRPQPEAREARGQQDDVNLRRERARDVAVFEPLE